MLYIKVNLYFHRTKIKFEAFKNISKSIDKDKKTITIKWDCNEKDDLEAMLVYRGYDKMKMGRYKIIDQPDMDITDAYEDQAAVYYVLKPIYKTNKGDFRSDYIELVLNIELPKNNK